MNERRYIWKVNFRFNYCELSDIWETNNMILKPASIDEIPIIEGQITLDTDNDDLGQVLKLSREQINRILDAYSVLSGYSLKVQDISPKLVHRPTPPKGPIYAPAISPIRRIIVCIPVKASDFTRSKDLLLKIEARVDKQVVYKIIRWFRRGIESVDVYDKFISLWISFNALYNHSFIPTGRRDFDRSEKNRFLQLVDRLLDEKESQETVNSHLKEMNLLVNTNLTSCDGRINYSEKLRQSLQNKDHKESIRNAISCIYMVRCDLFHGEKVFTQEEKNLLNNCTSLLKEIIKKSLFSFITKQGTQAI